MRRPRLLDVFCGPGGAAVGYARAGFDVFGVDVTPQPSYPFPLHQGDVFEVAEMLHFGVAFTSSAERGTAIGGMWTWDDFDAVHASPPCQHYANVTRWRRSDWDGDATRHPALIEPTRRMLEAWGGPFVIENVRTAEVRADLVLCGSSFGLPVRRHRYFELSWRPPLMAPSCNHADLLPFEHKGERAYADAMGCEWMNKKEARQAIPPAYTEYIGGLLREHLRRAA